MLLIIWFSCTAACTDAWCSAEAAAPQVGRFVVPLIMGSLQQLPDLHLGKGEESLTLTLTLIARRCTQRPGVRHWRRGADPGVRLPLTSPPAMPVVARATLVQLTCSSPVAA